MQNLPKSSDAGNGPAPVATWRELAAGVAAMLDALPAFRRALDDSQQPSRERRVARAEELLIIYGATALRAMELLVNGPAPEACGAALVDAAHVAHVMGRVAREVPNGGDVPPSDDAAALEAHRLRARMRRAVALLPADPEGPRTESHRMVNALLRAAETVQGDDLAERRAAVAFLQAAMHPSVAAIDRPPGFHTEGLIVMRHRSRGHGDAASAVRDALDLVGLGAEWERVQALKSKRHVRAVRKRGARRPA